MKILKFGGNAIDNILKIREIADLVLKSEKSIVVLASFFDTKETLSEIAGYLYQRNPDSANETINRLENAYRKIVAELYSSEVYKKQAIEQLDATCNLIRNYTKDLFTLFEEKIILAQGELLTVALFYLYLKEKQAKVALLPALGFMKIDRNEDPDPVFIRDNLKKSLAALPDSQIYLTEGFICKNAYGEIDNLNNPDGNLTASLIGAAVQAEEIQIWSDADGMNHKKLHFEEAAELAYFGAKMLHPTCILPAKLNNIPVRLMNTTLPDDSGTLISNHLEKGKIKAVAAKDGITFIKIKSGRMLLAHGFLRKVFEIFESHRTSIDMVVTSEVGISVTIDNATYLKEILDDLKKYGTVTVETDMTIVCVVGDLDSSNLGYEAKAVDALKNIPIYTISYGGSKYNISFLIKTANKAEALKALSENLF
jgi:aspartate kinase